MKRARTIQDATKFACEVPLRVMQTAASALPMLEAMVEKGNPNSVTDAGVGVLCIRAAVQGACFNVLVNAKDLKDTDFAQKITGEARKILADVLTKTDAITAAVEKAIS